MGRWVLGRSLPPLPPLPPHGAPVRLEGRVSEGTGIGGAQTRLGLSKLRLEKAWRWKGAGAPGRPRFPSIRAPDQQLYARKARGAAMPKEKRHPSCCIPARGPAHRVLPGQVCRPSRLGIWGGRNQPPVAQGASVLKAHLKGMWCLHSEAPFSGAHQGLRKNPIVTGQKRLLSQRMRSQAPSKDAVCLLPRERLPQTLGFVVQTSKLLKHPATQWRKTQTPGSGFAQC